MEQFRAHYGNKKLTKEAIFHYVYAVLHHPAYRSKYEQNLKRDFPRIPLYQDFGAWAAAGQKLMELHLHYEQVAPYAGIKIVQADKPKAEPKARLQRDKEINDIVLDENTTLTGIPSVAFLSTNWATAAP